jgi:hypothetical protein
VVITQILGSGELFLCVCGSLGHKKTSIVEIIARKHLKNYLELEEQSTESAVQNLSLLSVSVPAASVQSKPE